MMKLHIKNRYLFLADLILCFFAYVLVIRFLFPASDFRPYFLNGIPTILSSAFIFVFLLLFFGLYRVDWLYAGVTEYIRLAAGCLLGAACSVFAGLFMSPMLFFKFNVAAAIACCVLICFLRFAVRFICKLSKRPNTKQGARVLIIGAGRLAVSLLREIQEDHSLHYHVVGLIDDDPEKARLRLAGACVLGRRQDIPRICKEKQIDEIIFAIFQLPAKDRTDILDICSSTGKKVKILPNIGSMLENKNVLSKAREIDIEDLLERDPIVLDNPLVTKEICGKVILVTGGGGSIGSELCRQIASFHPGRLVILDIYENTTYELQNELAEAYPDLQMDVCIASVRDKTRLSQIFRQYRPEIVFHAAAHKHVPLMEFNPAEAIKNNVFGTYNTVQCAEEYGVRRFVLISTDKAVNPTNIMGASKRLCEMIVQSKQNSKTEFVAVRFGNVLGSNGSVLPRFKKQIAAGGPVTITHPEITRFFMTIPEAASLVLQAAAYAKGGEIFVLDMGSPVRIYDLARKLIHLSGLVPDRDIPIVFTGLRPGEKLYEELLMSEEGLTKTRHDKIFVGKPIEISPEDLEKKLEVLSAVLQDDTASILDAFASVVPTYQRPHTA